MAAADAVEDGAGGQGLVEAQRRDAVQFWISWRMARQRTQIQWPLVVSAQLWVQLGRAPLRRWVGVG